MAYINKNSELHSGYNPYIDSSSDDMGTMMDVGLLIMEEGDTYRWSDEKKEAAFLLFEGDITYEWDGKTADAVRPDTFHHGGWCLLAGCGTEVRITANAHSEIYIQSTVNEKPYEAVLYTPDSIQVQYAGCNGELKGCIPREVKTFFDYDNAPFSNMVLGEVITLPGKWSSYPPHWHPQPEVYFYRFDRPQGFGAGFSNGEVHKAEHNGLLTITHGFHSQAAAPGYAMLYSWGIRHIDGDPWKKTRIDDEEHLWLLEPDANDHIYSAD